MNPSIQKLAEYFEKLPGIGPRQARRFVYSLLNKNKEFVEEFSGLISNLKKDTATCQDCNRFFSLKNNSNCNICQNTNRNKQTVMVVEKDIDLNNIEKAGSYNGLYFVLGGLIPPIGAELPKEVKMRELFEKIKKEATTNNIKEVILAFNATTEGENTANYTEKILEPITKVHPIKISRLGRGLSTGTELEYSDKETIFNALKNRK